MVLLVSLLAHLALLAAMSGTGPGGRGGGRDGDAGGYWGKSSRPGVIAVARIWEGNDSASAPERSLPAAPPRNGEALLLPAREKAGPPQAAAQPEPRGPKGPGLGNGQGAGVGDGTGDGWLPFGFWGQNQNREGLEAAAEEKEPGVEPSIAFCPKPKYPQVARDRKLEGSVRLQIEILPDGNAGDVFVIKSSGFAELDQAAVENVKKECKFFPGRRGGEPVTRRAERTIRFSLVEAE